jgi:hypothetical protein
VLALMPNRNLTEQELESARALLKEIRERLVHILGG